MVSTFTGEIDLIRVRMVSFQTVGSDEFELEHQDHTNPLLGCPAFLTHQKLHTQGLGFLWLLLSNHNFPSCVRSGSSVLHTTFLVGAGHVPRPESHLSTWTL